MERAYPHPEAILGQEDCDWQFECHLVGNSQYVECRQGAAGNSCDIRYY